MKITICSAFRSATRHLTRYFAQVEHLRHRLSRRGDTLSLVLGEGDHTDDTREKLPAWVEGFDAQIIQIDHDGPEYGPVVDAQRFSQLAFVWSCIWDWIPDDAAAAIFLESDLVWHPDTLIALVDQLDKRPAIAPMVMDGPASFYDTYAFVMMGEHFTKAPPFHPVIVGATKPITVDSAGSCLVMRGELARELVWTDEVIVGICRQIWEMDKSVWLDPHLEVIHP
jgi:hypothetical protein